MPAWRRRAIPKWPAPAGALPTGAVYSLPTIQPSSSAVWKFGKRTYKPNSVVCGHSSRRRVAADTHQRPTRRFRQWLKPPGRIGPIRSVPLALEGRIPPYLVLLRVGFTLPRTLQPGRCALTAPFHPYRTDRPGNRPSGQLSMPKHGNPAVSFLWHWPSTDLEVRVPDVIRHTALRSSDFPPPKRAKARLGSDRPVLLPGSILPRERSVLPDSSVLRPIHLHRFTFMRNPFFIERNCRSRAIC
jgi:hypothetical protein